MLVPCKACGGACSTMCEGLSTCLCPHNRPSPLFTLFSILMNGLLILFAIMGLTADGEATGDINTWFLVTLGIGAANIAFAVYLYWRFASMTAEADHTGRLGAAQAAWKLCMYDIGVFIYLVFAVFVIVWSFLDFDCDKVEGRYLCGDKRDDQSTCRILIWIYLLLGAFIVLISLCTECCKPPRRATSTTSTHQYQHQYQQYQQTPAQAAPPMQPHQYQQQQQQPPPHQYQQQQQQAPPPVAYQQQQPQQYGSMPPSGNDQSQQQSSSVAQKAGSAVGGLIGKGLNALKK